MAANPNQSDAPTLPPNEARTITDFSRIIDYWRPRAIILGGMTIQEIPAMHKVVFNAVSVDPDSKSTYALRKGGYSEDDEPDQKKAGALQLSLNVLDEIGRAAGVAFDNTIDHSRTIIPADPRKPVYIVGLAKGVRLDLAGQKCEANGEYAFDGAARAELQWIAFGRTWDKWNRSTDPKWRWTTKEKWLDEEVLKFILESRTRGMPFAQSCARRNVMKILFPELRNGFAAEDLRTKTILVPRLVVAPDYKNDAQARTFLLAAQHPAAVLAFGAARVSPVAALLGEPEEPVKALAAPATETHSDNPAEDTPSSTSSESSTSTQSETAQTTSGQQLTAPAGQSDDLPSPADFVGMTKDARVKLVEYLVATRVREKAPTKPIGEYGDEAIAKWYAAYLTCPVKEDLP